MSSVLPSDEVRRSPEIHAKQLDECTGFVTLRKPTSTVWLDLPEKDSGSHLDPKTCSPVDYVEHFIYPDLLPALHRLLDLQQQLPIRKYVNPVDWIALDLYKNNPRHSGRSDLQALEIQFVKDALHERELPVLPLRSVLSDDDAALVIQSRWRGYHVRSSSVIAQFRQWMKKRREETKAASVIVRTMKKYTGKRGEDRRSVASPDLQLDVQDNGDNDDILLVSSD